MDKAEISGTYDAIYSLGGSRLTSVQLRKHNLLTCSEVFDWIDTPELKKVNKILKNRFSYLMDDKNIKVKGFTGEVIIWVTDSYYEFLSNSRFDKIQNSPVTLGGFGGVRERYKRRIEFFLETLNSANRILFVRTEGSYEEVLELQKVLSELVKNEFNILLINHETVNEFVEKDWRLAKTYAVDFPKKATWKNNDDHWNKVLKGIKLKK